jgi:tetratricopeptide (TPR) repeat protein
LQELGESDKAENFYRRMLANEPNITDEQRGLLHFHIGMLRVKKEDYFGALDALNKAIPYFPSPTVTFEKASFSTTSITDASISNRLAVYFHIGLIHYLKQNWKEAQEALEHASVQEGSPEDLAKIHGYLGELALICGNHKQLGKCYERAVELINKSSGREEVKKEFKRKFDEVLQLCDQMEERLKPKRQCTRSGNEPTS